MPEGSNNKVVPISPHVETTDFEYQHNDFGSGDGGPPVDRETERHIDTKVEAVKAQNDARFGEVISRLDAMNPATWWQNGLLLAAAIGFVFSILAYASDRFDSGVASMGAVEEALDAQREINAAQDLRLERILTAMEAQINQPQGSPEESQE